MATHITTPPLSAWAQVTDDALQCNKDGAVMVRTYKLPTSCCTAILDGLKIGMTIQTVENWISSQAGSLDSGVPGAVFTPATGDAWGLASYQLQQITAGQYMILKTRYEYTGINVLPAPEDDWSEEKQMSINVSWTSYSVSPYIYCDEEVHNDKVVSDSSSWEQNNHACRRHIESTFLGSVNQQSQNPYRYINGVEFELTNAEQEIKDKVATGVTPVFHKPIITRTNMFRTNQETKVPDTGNHQIDRIDNNPAARAPQWSGRYIYVGRSYTKSTNTYYNEQHPEGIVIYNMTYTDMWEGALEPDEDFYGPNAWEFHEGPSRGG